MNEKNRNTPPAASTDKKPGALGEHPVGTGLGAIGTGAAAGALGGAVAGPVGAVAGAVVGAVVGGVAGNAVAEAIDPDDDTDYWRKSHAAGPHARNGSNFEEYAPAYRYGAQSYRRLGAKGQSFDSAEADLGRGWNEARSGSPLAWGQAREACRDAWNHQHEAACGDKGNACKDKH
ncbi:MAG TPA: hypothetical protein PLU35_10500 [Phycisphaerales bacterium]|nr:hypothetical protein [Phycisphaerales bacterium]